MKDQLVQIESITAIMPLDTRSAPADQRAKLSFGKSESAPQHNKYFYRNFAGYGHNGKAYAAQETVETREGNINIT